MKAGYTDSDVTKIVFEFDDEDVSKLQSDTEMKKGHAARLVQPRCEV